ncbi:hypothetical protein HMPREF1544_11263, partial [Mucor circinelloides 1006PhL]
MDATIVFENPSDANQSLRTTTVETTTSVAALSPVVDLERTVFLKMKNQTISFDFSDEEESEDEHSDADPDDEEFTEPDVEESFEAE